MKQIRILMVMTVLGMLAFTSCNEDEVVNLLPYNNINEFFESQRPQRQTKTVDVTQPQAITLDNGTVVTFGASTFCNPDYSPANGMAEIEFVEVFKPSEMIFEEKLTVSDGKLLESGGEFFMKAKQANTELKICGMVQVTIPKSTRTSNPNAMQLFAGQETPDGFNWVADSLQNEFWVDSNSYNAALFQDFDWINCDYFYNESGPKTTVSALPVGNEGTSTNTKAFLVFTDINAVAPLQFKPTSGKFESYENSMPIGQNVKIVIIGMSDTGFYLGIDALLVINELSSNVPMTEVSEAELIAAIEALN